MDRKIKIFISWSKNKSKLLAEITKEFLMKTIGNSVEFFFSPEMYKGSCVDHEIHKNLINSDICFVCITSDNFKSPWLMYESGVIYGANYNKRRKGIVIPILFEHIPAWSSWIDKPLNRYVPIQMQNNNHEFDSGKKEFKSFLNSFALENNTKIISFEKNWKEFEEKILKILAENDLIPTECKYIVETLLKTDNAFVVSSPEIYKNKILFHQGFATHPLTKILTDAIVMDSHNTLWIFGRKNKKILSREYEPFFKYLADEGLANGKDFRCLFPMPKSNAILKASSKDRKPFFDCELEFSLRQAVSLKNKFGLPIEKVFRLYFDTREDSIIRLDSAVLHRKITRDLDGDPLPYTNSEFEIYAKSSEKGNELIRKFDSVWNDEDKSCPLTEELLEILYGSKE